MLKFILVSAILLYISGEVQGQQQPWPNFPFDQACKVNTCRKGDTTCECYFTIEHRVTMMLESERMLLRAVQGRVHRYNETATLNRQPRYTTLNNLSNILTLDGNGSRLVISINEQFPGPELQAYEGQTMIVHVRNLMHTDSTTIHWHGIHQRGSPWADGVAFITQCPILPGQYYTYRFKLSQSGTYFYHAHIGDQRSMGLYGPFIVQPATTNVASKEHTVIIQDWNHDEDPETLYQRMLWGTYNFQSYQRIDPLKSVDSTEFSRFVFHSGIINGKGRYYFNLNSNNGAPLTQYQVESNQEYRFRVISAATLFPFRVFVQQHRNLRVVASDGFEFDPVTVESFIIQPGERFDFILLTDQTPNDYLLVAESLEQGTTNYHAAEAMIRYNRPSAEPYPNPLKAIGNSCNVERCKVLNCPFEYYPSATRRDCISLDTLTLKNSNFVNIRLGVTQEKFFNFAFPGENGNTPGSVNGRQFNPPVSHLLSGYDDSTITSCASAECGDNSICTCTYSEEIQDGRTYQFILSNIGNGRGWSHPVHLHGHSFYLLKIGLGSYNPTDASFLSETRDISCGGTKNFCNRETWANSSWSGNNIPGLNLVNPILKDTIIVPSGGYVVVRFKADNPGPWFFHCHIDLHNTNGMGMVIDETPSGYRGNIPAGFPSCGNFEDNDDDEASSVQIDANKWLLNLTVLFVVVEFTFY